jgi:hypothetical protein
MGLATRIVLVAGLALSASTAWAHHSYAAFDPTRTLTVQGTVRALEWTNPHIWVWIDVPGEHGAVITFGFESNAPSELARFFGWTKHSLTVGEQVRVDYSPLKSGRPGGLLRTLTFGDGRTLRTPQSNAGARTGAATPGGPADRGVR